MQQRHKQRDTDIYVQSHGLESVREANVEYRE